MTKIVEATGHAQASSVRRQNAARARELRDEVAKAVEDAHAKGLSIDMIQARMNEVRVRIGRKHDERERLELAERVERENRIRETIRKRHPDLSPADQETMAQRAFLL